MRVRNEADQATSELTELRLAMRSNGYRPVPVTGPKVDCRGAGKAPLMKDWQKVCAGADEKEIRSWSTTKPDHTNTGILCGDVVGVDIDVTDADLVEKIVALAKD